MLDNSRVTAGLHLAKYMQDPSATESILACINAEMGGNLFTLSDKDILDCIANKQAEAQYIKSLPDAKQMEEFVKILESYNEDDEVFQSFIDMIKAQPSMPMLYEYCNCFEEYGSKAAFRRTHDYPGVVLTTAHSSKGLEWDIVFNSISKYDEPMLHLPNKADAVEERRRLFFVSMTRARDDLYITGLYTAYGSEAKGYTYNQFLKEVYLLTGQEFSASTIEAERAMVKEEKKKQKLAELDENTSPLVPQALLTA